MASSAEEGAQPVHENFLRKFRDAGSQQLKKFTATQFMEVWTHYDSDGTCVYLHFYHNIINAFYTRRFNLSVFLSIHILMILC